MYGPNSLVIMRTLARTHHLRALVKFIVIVCVCSTITLCEPIFVQIKLAPFISLKCNFHYLFNRELFFLLQAAGIYLGIYSLVVKFSDNTLTQFE